MSEATGSPVENLDVHSLLVDVGGGEGVQFGFSYMARLGEALGTLDPSQLPAALAGVILEAPTDNDSWRQYNVQAGFAEILYTGAALTAFSCAARDVALTEELTARLGAAAPATLAERVPLFVNHLPARALNTPGSSIEACAKLSIWTLEQAYDDEARQGQMQAIAGSARRRTIEEIATFERLLSDAGLTTLSKQLAIEAAARLALEAKQAEALRVQAAEAARKAEERQAEEFERAWVQKSPDGALAELAERVGVLTAGDVENLDAGQISGLLYAADSVIDRLGYRKYNKTTDRTAVLNLASAVLETALRLQRQGHAFDDPRTAHYIHEYERMSVTLAPSEEKFWEALAQYAEWHENLSSSTVAGLYTEWKGRYVDSQRYERAQQVLDQAGAEATDFIPQGCTNIEVTPWGGTVVYEDINDLLGHMRRYYVPRADRFDSFIANYTLAATSSGLEGRGMAVLGCLNELAGVSDEANMDRIEQEIRAWLLTDQATYRDSRDAYGGDPYKYETTSFGCQGISITRTGSGNDRRYALRIEGRGHGGGGDPTKYIEQFAIINKQNITFDDGLTIKYTADAPADVERVTRPDYHGPRDFVKLEVPLGNILRTLGRTLEYKIADIDEMARAIVEANEYEGAAFRFGDYMVKIRLDTEDMTYDPATAKVTGYRIILEPIPGESEEFALAQAAARVSVGVEFPGALKNVVERAVAASTILHSDSTYDRRIHRVAPQKAAA